jgi:malonate transporter and related proteins
MLTIATTLIPVAFVTFLGYFAGRRNAFNVADRTRLTKLILDWLLPPLLLGGVLETPRADMLDYKIPLIFVVGLLVPFFLALLVCRFGFGYNRSKATIKANLWAFPDMVFMGIPILGELFGPSSLFPILIANLVPTLIIMPLDTVLLELGSKGATHVGRDVFFKTVFPALRKARVWAPFLGVALVILNVQLPHVVINSLDLIGRATTGISLFVVGLIISQGAVELSGAVAIDVFLKNLVHPAVMLATVWAFGVTGVLAREAVLLAAIPTAVITTMFAEEYGILRSESSTSILATRVLSFATIPIIIGLTQHL